jgi:hypothetical protein
VPADVRDWTTGIIVASAVIFLGAVARHAPVTAAVHFLVVFGAVFVMLSQPAAAPAAPVPVPSYYTPCYSGQHCS